MMMSARSLNREHSVEDFLEARLLNNVHPAANNDGTLARLVDRFRNEPPKPRVSRTNNNKTGDFWWLYSSPSHESTPISDHGFDQATWKSDQLDDSWPATPKKNTSSKVSVLTASLDESYNAIDFRANRLLELTDSTISSDDSRISKKCSTKSTVETSADKLAYAKQPTLYGTKSTVETSNDKLIYANQPALHAHYIRKHETSKSNRNTIKNPWRNDPKSNNNFDILQQWRLARKMELARKNNEPNAFLESNDFRKSDTKHTMVQDKNVNITQNLQNSSTAIEQNIDHSGSIKKSSAAHRKTSDNSAHCKLSDYQISNGSKSEKTAQMISQNKSHKDNYGSDTVAEKMSETSKKDCQFDEKKTSRDNPSMCLFCWNNQLALHTPFHPPQYPCSHALPHHTHKICDILPCSHTRQPFHVATQSQNNGEKDDSFKDSRKLHVTSERFVSPQHNEIEDQMPVMNSTTASIINRASNPVLHSVVNQVVADGIFNSNTSDDIDSNITRSSTKDYHMKDNPIENKQRRKSNKPPCNDEHIEFQQPSNEVYADVTCKSPGDEFEYDDVLQDLRKRRDILQERLKAIDKLLTTS